MKGIDIFCASQAAITTMDSDIHLQPSSSSNSGRAIDRHNPIIQDQKRQTKTIHIPLPFSTTSNNKNNNNNNNKKKSKKPETNKDEVDQKRKIIAFADENSDHQVIITNKNVKKQGGVLLGWGCTKPSEFISPATSSRFLLADKSLSDQFDPLLKQLPPPPPPPPPLPLPLSLPLPTSVKTFETINGDKSFKKKDDVINLSSSSVITTPRSSSSLSSRSSDHQVVVLRVSLHCKGCVKKMSKHLSKMEGVTSFNIDFLAKKVTVVGDITPLAVLTSISKVKNAKLLTPTTISSQPVPQSDSNFSDIKKQFGLVV